MTRVDRSASERTPTSSIGKTTARKRSSNLLLGAKFLLSMILRPSVMISMMRHWIVLARSSLVRSPLLSMRKNQRKLLWMRWFQRQSCGYRRVMRWPRSYNGHTQWVPFSSNV